MTEFEAAAQEEVAFPYLAGLNDAQREAVEALDGPVLVLAGAGTGKTRVLTIRLVHLMATGRARPWQILAVTFTNRAAREMKERVAALLGRPVESWWIGTFHSVAARMLRGHAELVGLKPNFTILDTDDQLRLIKQLIEAEGIDEKKWPARSLLAVISRWKDRGLEPEKLPAGEAMEAADGKAALIYGAYQSRLKTLNACDFGDLLLHCITLFQQQPEVLADYHRRLRYLLVDEYQDSNVAQYLWLRLLAQKDKNLCCVGDDDQSIYGWRGAEVGNILRFEQDFPGAKVVRLERNYRSTGHILGAAGGLIAENRGRLGKTLWTEDEMGEKVRLRGLWDGDAEARFVGEEIEALHSKGKRLSEMAVLVRAGSQTRAFEERFITLGLPYRVIGGPRFYERLEIRDALAYLRVIHQPDDDLAFERIVNTPKRGLGTATLRLLHAAARAASQPLLAAARSLVETDELKPRARRALADLTIAFDRWRALADGLPQHELAEIVLDESGYTAMWQNDKSVEAPGRLDNLKELVAAMAEFENLAGFLEHVSLVMESIEGVGEDMVSLMTLHSAKGLEFETVFLPGWEEGLFPNQRALDEHGLKGLEEERRLAYVGLTRACRRAIVSYAANRHLYGHWADALPSRFVEELPDQHVGRESDQGVYAGSSSFTDWGMTRATPGMSRARQRVGQAAPFIDVVAQPVESLPSDSYRKGARVFHQKFGYGTVLVVEGEKLDIDFDKAGRKKVMASFVVPQDRMS